VAQRQGEPARGRHSQTLWMNRRVQQMPHIVGENCGYPDRASMERPAIGGPSQVHVIERPARLARRNTCRSEIAASASAGNPRSKHYRSIAIGERLGEPFVSRWIVRLQFAVACLLVASLNDPAHSQSLACVDVIAPSDSAGARFGDVAEGRNGRLAWTDGRPGQILLRDESGVVRVVGRRGAGPGEFDRPTLLVWRADTLLASDFRHRRVQAFSDTGMFLRTMTGLIPAVWSALPDGRLATIRPVVLSDESSLPFVLVSQRPEDLSIDTVARFDNPAVERFERVVGNQRVRNQQPFEASAHANWTRDGSRFCGISPSGAGVRLRCTDAAGRELLNRQLSLQPRPITNAMYDSVVRAHVAGGNREEDMRSKIKRPRSLPLALGLTMNEAGEAWLQRSHDTEDPRLWARIRADGSVRDEVAIPRRYRLLRPDGDFVWAATADADGLETLHKCRISR